MTNRDIFIQIFSETSGMSLDQVRALVTARPPVMGPEYRLDDPISEEMGEQVLTAFRQLLPSIRLQMAEEAMITGMAWPKH